MTNVDASINTFKGKFYADNGVAEQANMYESGTFNVDTADISQAAAKLLLGLTEAAITGVTGITDTNPKELIYDDDMNIPFLGAGFIIKKMVNNVLAWRAVVFKRVKFDIPNEAAETQGETINWQTDNVSAEIVRDESAKHEWKREATFTTEAQAEAYIKNLLSIT